MKKSRTNVLVVHIFKAKRHPEGTFLDVFSCEDQHVHIHSSPPDYHAATEKRDTLLYYFPAKRQVGPELLHEMRIVEQARPSLAPFPYNGQMLVVEREVEIFYIEGKSLKGHILTLKVV